MNTRPRPAVVLLAVSILMLITAVIAIAVAGSRMGGENIDSIGDRVAAQSPSADPSPTGPSPVGPTVLPNPVRVRIPQIGVTAPVIPTGLDKNRSAVIPEDIMKVG